MNDDVIKELWVDKYRPSKLENYILNDNIKQYFKNMVSSRQLQNCIFAGIQGSGKTTLAKILCNEFNAEVLFVKCATEGTIDVLRSKVEPFCNAMSIDGRLKVVVLDELDSASQTGQNNFQLALRTLIEAAQDDTRFIGTCNFANKVQPAILSRCPIIPLKFDKKDLLCHVKSILDLEKVKYDKESLRAFVEESFKFYPDCRQIINYLQLCSNSGTLTVNLSQVVESDQNNLLVQLVKKIKSAQKIMDIRSFYMQNKSKVDDYKILGAQLYDYVIDNSIVTNSKAILKMSDIIYQMNLVVNPEIQFFALVCLIYECANA